MAVRMPVILRILFPAGLLLLGWGGGYLAGRTDLGLLYGLLAGILSVLAEMLLRRLPLGSLLGGAAGLVSGTLCAYFVSIPLRSFMVVADLRVDVLPYIVLGYAGLAIGLHRGRTFSLARVVDSLRERQGSGPVKILDTSAIIDGRIADVCETGFVEGPFVIPQFVLRELQHIADSADPNKRMRGRRGLDILRKIQKMSGVDIRIVDEEFPRIREVDEKLVAMARMHHGKVVTTDYNLNKVCEVQGVGVLNVNELANSLRPVILPGESMKVAILKEGKEPHQGVAYLDDGTMVVVENASRLMGKKIEVSVTSVLQTTAGRMIFGKPRDEESSPGEDGSPA